MLEPLPLEASDPRSARTIHLMAEAERRAFADRAAWLGDPDFFTVPLTGLLSKQYALTRAADILPHRATPSAAVRAGDPRSVPLFGRSGRGWREPGTTPNMAESANTTHYAVVDRWKNVVAVTTTLNGMFGSKAVAAGTGVLLNNEMDDFSVKPGAPNLYGLVGGKANEIRPGKRPLSSMCPTIVLKNNQPWLVLGTPGGSTIITSVLQVFLNVVEHGMGLGQAVAAPRVHHQWLPDTISAEEGALSPGTVAELRAMGHTVSVREPIGDLHAIRIDPARGVLEGACDPRGAGEPRGR